MKIKVEKLDPNAKLPTKGSDGAAGWDLYAAPCSNAYFAKGFGDKVIVHTGIAVEIPKGHFGAVFARSGLSCEKGLRPANCVGVIDSDYRGEVMVVLRNDTDSMKTIKIGDRVAQLVILPCPEVEFEEVRELSSSNRGAGGFGSSGV